MPGKANYVVVAIRASGVPTQIERTFKGAPKDEHLAMWARRKGPRGVFELVVRYYPSRKGWLILDVRNASIQPSGHLRYARWVGIVRGTKVYPNESAAVMKAIHLLNLPVQQSLNL